MSHAHARRCSRLREGARFTQPARPAEWKLAARSQSIAERVDVELCWLGATKQPADDAVTSFGQGAIPTFGCIVRVSCPEEMPVQVTFFRRKENLNPTSVRDVLMRYWCAEAAFGLLALAARLMPVRIPTAQAAGAGIPRPSARRSSA
jgi:hypothetical protein